MVFGGGGWILVGLVDIRLDEVGFRRYNVRLSGISLNWVGYVGIGRNMLGLGGVDGF